MQRHAGTSKHCKQAHTSAAQALPCGKLERKKEIYVYYFLVYMIYVYVY
jgi:hypothetical protein